MTRTALALAAAHNLRCACCGADAGKWQQFTNQDEGYGICRGCADSIQARERDSMPQADFRRTYGVPGINYEPHRFRYVGRSYVVLATFPETDAGTIAANAYMAEFAGASVLDIQGGRVILADVADRGL